MIIGSSPLARGLLRWGRRRRKPGRIIPARAGFTRLRGSWSIRVTDHPRSRGVYQVGCGRGECRTGSSPLARGLPDRIPREFGHRRIIPARAGFTSLSPGPGTTLPDHPRSRGVYSLGASKADGETGSSPLARGLPKADGETFIKKGIIPARAGFTADLDPPGGEGLDHPRSRGVYGR